MMLGMQVGHVRDGSAFKNQASDWVAFGELFRSSRVFVMQVAPVKLDWLQELAPAYNAEMLTELQVGIYVLH